MERLRVNHHPEPLPESINIVKCRSASIMPERGRRGLGQTMLALGLAAATVIVSSQASLASEVPLQASPQAASASVLLRQTGVPGLAIAVVHADRMIDLKCFGVREVGKAGSVDTDTVFQLASLSKPLASTVVASVVGEGGLHWDEAKVTLRDLFSHRSGLPDHAGDHLEDIGFDRDTIRERLRLLPTGNRFRADHAPTNFGFTAAAEAVAVGQGLSWAELSNQRLYRPLGMTRTSSSHADLLAFSNRAVDHAGPYGLGWNISNSALIGVPETIALTFLDLAIRCQPRLDCGCCRSRWQGRPGLDRQSQHEWPGAVRAELTGASQQGAARFRQIRGLQASGWLSNWRMCPALTSLRITTWPMPVGSTKRSWPSFTFLSLCRVASIASGSNFGSCSGRPALAITARWRAWSWSVQRPIATARSPAASIPRATASPCRNVP